MVSLLSLSLAAAHVAESCASQFTAKRECTISIAVSG
jgi:hypothetical protein